MSGNSEDCLACRLTSGGGLIGASIYVITQSRKFQSYSRHAITAIGAGIGVLGSLRLLNLPPFRKISEPVKTKPSPIKSDNETYVIELFPSGTR